jgi:hypothetical protein
LAARVGRDGACRPLAPSHADACNPLVQAHPTRARDKHEGRRVSPFTSVSLWFSPLRAPSRADPSGLGHAATIHSSFQGPPGVETPTKNVDGGCLKRLVFGSQSSATENKVLYSAAVSEAAENKAIFGTTSTAKNKPLFSAAEP